MSAIDVATQLVRQFEGCKLTAYRDQDGNLTIGWGHRLIGPDVTEGLSWTQQRADFALGVDLRVAADGVSRLLSRPLAYGQMGALISLAFNVGVGALKGTRLIDLVNAGQWIPAARDLTAWDHIAQNESRGLLIRRLDEAATFLRGSP